LTCAGVAASCARGRVAPAIHIFIFFALGERCEAGFQVALPYESVELVVQAARPLAFALLLWGCLHAAGLRLVEQAWPRGPLQGF